MQVFSTRDAEHKAATKHFEKTVADQSVPCVIFPAIGDETVSQLNPRFGCLLPIKTQNSLGATQSYPTVYRCSFEIYSKTLDYRSDTRQLCLVSDFPEESATAIENWIASPGRRGVTLSSEASLSGSG